MGALGVLKKNINKPITVIDNEIESDYIKSKDKLINNLEMIIKKKDSITYSREDFIYFKKIFYN